jgi:hypothetical protein
MLPTWVFTLPIWLVALIVLYALATLTVRTGHMGYIFRKAGHAGSRSVGLN